MRLNVLLFLFFSFAATPADVQIITDVGKGQGFLYAHNNECYVVTPSHVIDEAVKISALTAHRNEYTVKLVKNFAIDLALLKLLNAKEICKTATFNQSQKLSSLLNDI